jgi:MarR family transcriptional regulator for hemolysin
VNAALSPTAAEPGASPLNANLGWLLAQAAHVLQTELSAAFEELGFGPRGFCVLSAASTGELTQKELAEMVGLDKTTMVVTVDDLEREGLAERLPSPTDRRARIIAVTARGRKAIATGEKVVAGIQEDVLATLPEERREDFMAALSELVCGRLSTPAACERAPRRRS